MTKDPLFLTKLAGAALVAAWIFVGATLASWLLYQPQQELEEPAYPLLLDTAVVDQRPVAPETPPAGSEAPAEADGDDLAALLAAADPAAGQKQARKCVACHSFDAGGGHKIGPNLWDVVGRAIGAADGYRYSAALAEHGGVWGYEELDAFFASPKSFAEGTKMTFAGIKDAADRANLIAYLRGLSDNPQPLP